MPRFVLITRHPAECHELQELLRTTDLVLRPFPVLRLEDVDDAKAWKKVTKLPPSDPGSSSAWLVFASPRAPLRYRAAAARHNAAHLLDLPVAVVGDGTKSAAEDAGFEVRLVGPGTGVGLAAALTTAWSEPKTVLFGCGHDRRRELPDALREDGHTVIPIELYAMKPTPHRELPPLGPNLEAVILTSPRCAHYYLEGVGGHPLPCPHWALGPTTRDAAQLMGIDCRIPSQPSLSSLAEELCQI